MVPAFVASSRNGAWLLPLLNTALVGVLDLGKTNVKSTSQYSCSVAQCSACGFPLLDNEYGHGLGEVTFAAAEAGQCVLYRSQTAPGGSKGTTTTTRTTRGERTEHQDEPAVREHGGKARARLGAGRHSPMCLNI